MINREVQLTPDVAIRPKTVLGVQASFGNNLEAIYREKLIKAEAEDSLDHDLEREHPKDCVNLQTDVRYNYSVWRFLKWPEKKIRHKKQ